MDCVWNEQHLIVNQDELSNLSKETATILKQGSNTQYLETLADLALNPAYTEIVFAAFEPLFVDLCTRWLDRLSSKYSPLAVVAFLARVLPCAPHLSLYAEEVACKRKAGQFAALFSSSVIALSELPDSDLVALLGVIYRLLKFDDCTFAVLVPPPQILVLMGHGSVAVRCLAIRIFCVFMRTSDAVYQEMMDQRVGDAEPYGVLDTKVINFRFLPLWEEKRLGALRQRLRFDKSVSSNVTSHMRRLGPTDLTANTACLAGVLIPCLKCRSLQTPLVMTPTTLSNLQRVAHTIKRAEPMLVTGLPGCGKTSLVQHTAQQLGTLSAMVILHLNEQTDSKSLVGMYTSASTPGSFKWQQGVLTTAVLEGRWVFIEDLDRAPAEVTSMLLPLLDRNELLVPHLGGWKRAAHGFKLIATIRSSLSGRGDQIDVGSAILGSRHWTKVKLEQLSDSDLSDIIKARFPILIVYEPGIMNMYHALGDLEDGPMEKAGLVVSPGSQQLLRFCSRLETLLMREGVLSTNDPIPEHAQDAMFLEAVDCFSAASRSKPVRARIASVIAREMSISAERAQYCLHARVPVLSREPNAITVGRVSLSRTLSQSRKNSPRRPFAATNHTLRYMESIGSAIRAREPCLLVGETGTGKTTIVQELAIELGQKLIVVNLSQQSEASDLLGGYKPMNPRALGMPLYEEFNELYSRTFLLRRKKSSASNEKFLKSLERSVQRGDWDRTADKWRLASEEVRKTLNTPETSEINPKKRRKLDSSQLQELKAQWNDFSTRIEVFKQLNKPNEKGFAPVFVEGNIVKAVRSGAWVLLDEINLAPSDTLESLADLFPSQAGATPSLLLTETGIIERVEAHPNFRIFGAMNPATDVGKRDLPPSLRSRFTEYYIESPDQDQASLEQIVIAYLGANCNSQSPVSANVTRLYSAIKQLEDENLLVDGADQKPHFSLRTLTRTLIYANDIKPMYGLERALIEGFSMSFLTFLNTPSSALVSEYIDKYLLKSLKNARALLKQTPKPPNDNGVYKQFGHYLMACGSFPIEEQEDYIITPFVQANLMNLVRATSTRRYPVLLQGPTSSGKTSMVEYLAKTSGNKFVRINNHEHTDLQEYLGTYVSGADGLYFQEGVLVRALREGHWIVLDELNLAPTDVLEALNRLLDDNRELLIPETQEVVRPHKNFMLFATQNPPGLYGGRKILSRAFRNRFLELHFDDIPEDELETILVQRCKIAPSYGAQIVKVYKELALLRQSDRIFEQKNSFATLRDLFRWALRDAGTREELAVDGFMLLAERVRNADERQAVKQVIEKVMRVTIDSDSLCSLKALESIDLAKSTLSSKEIIWTKSARRLFVLVYRALKNQEPVLLVGGTGIGKTSICQAIAELGGTELNILNAHQNTETGDLIGSQRPLRNRSQIEEDLRFHLLEVFRIMGLSKEHISLRLDALIKTYHSIPPDGFSAVPRTLKSRVEQELSKSKALFEWSDGSLVRAMRTGTHFLLDEISLADDSVLERLNSVLEPARKLLLAEKGPNDNEVQASDGFQFLATMNPGGDYGKKELSPALRNRFTEIWVPNFEADDILEIASAKLKPSLRKFARAMIQFAEWFAQTFRDDPSISLREILSWVRFTNSELSSNPHFLLAHGAAMVFIDGLGASPSAARSTAEDAVAKSRQLCLSRLNTLFEYNMAAIYCEKPEVTTTKEELCAGALSIKRSNMSATDVDFSLKADTTRENAVRILRALQLDRPLLVEGSPGVGKTTLVAAISKLAGVPLTRINLSDQTDVMDLFGSDIPVEDGEAGQFTWSDAPFLQAMQRGEWVLLDEMNLASQSVLEGLNACLDHRGSVYVPELDKTFTKHPEFRVFAAQNPHGQGGGRKGLPASFVNRFTVVYAEVLKPHDLTTICGHLHPKLPTDSISSMVQTVSSLGSATVTSRNLSMKGGPWEFNLRDILRWLHLIDRKDSMLAGAVFSDLWDLLFLHRLRDPQDIQKARSQLSSIALPGPSNHTYFQNISQSWYQCGFGILSINGWTGHQYKGRPWQGASILESLMICIQQNWPCLLAGPSGSGKTTLIQHVASIVGADLMELPLNAESDTMDILGGYEQVDHLQKCSKFVLQLKSELRAFLVKAILENKLTESQIRLLLAGQDLETEYINPAKEYLERLQDSGLEESFIDLYEQCQLLVVESLRDARARFEWVDGPLIEALEQGKWFVLDNANLCGPSVLDRLNSLLEPNGFLSVNENRRPDGSVKVVRPHPNFRLFLTTDPRWGEVSRAMRNRCIELHLSEQQLIEERMVDPTYDSSCYRFRVFQSFDPSQQPPQVFRCLATAAMQSLAFSDLSSLDALHKDLETGLVELPKQYSEIFQETIDAFRVAAEPSSGLIHRIEDVYRGLSERAGLSIDFPQTQPIHPLNNAPLLSMLRHDSSTSGRVLWYAEALELRTMISLLASSFQRVANLADQKQATPGALSRLERSMLSGRDLRFSKDPTQPLQAFFSDAIRSVDALLTNTLTKEVSKAARLQFRAVVHFLLDVFELSNSATFEESYFQAYLSIGRTLANAIDRDSSIRDLGKLLIDLLSYFSRALKLSTGTSMEPLWKNFRPSTAKDLDHLRPLLDFEAVADEFDDLASRSGAPVATLSKLQWSLVRGFQHLAQSSATLNEIKAALRDERVSQSRSHQPRYRHFRAEFEGLRQYIALRSLDVPSDSIVNLLAGRSTTHSLHPNSDTESSKRLLRSIEATGIGDVNFELMPVRQVLPLNIMRKMISLPDVTIGALDTVREELDILGTRLATTTERFTQNNLSALNSHIQGLFWDVMRSHKHILHADSSIFQSPHSTKGQEMGLAELPEGIHLQPQFEQTFSAQQFQTIANKYFIPSVEDINLAECTQSYLKPSAIAWVKVFLGMLLLYVPDREYDPALVSVIECSQWSKRQDELHNKLTALCLLEQRNTGCKTNLRIHLLEDEIAAMGEQPEYPRIARPQVSRTAHLQIEFNSVLRDVVQRCQRISDLNKLAPADAEDVRAVRHNISLIVQRLSTQYREYDDLVRPAVLMLRGLDTGLALLLVAYHRRDKHHTETQPPGVTSSFGIEFRTGKNFRGLSAWKAKPALTDSTLFLLEKAVVEAQVEGKAGSLPSLTVSELFMTLYNRWKDQLEQDQEKHAVTSSLYRYQGNQDDRDVVDEGELRALFPDYDNPQIQEDAVSGSPLIDVQNLSWSTAILHQELISDGPPIKSKLLDLLQRSANNISCRKMLEAYESSPISAESLLPSVVLSLHEGRNNLTNSSPSAASYNFYEDANLPEVSKLLQLLERVQNRFIELKSSWPEHATLDDVLRCIQELKNFRHIESLAKVLTKVEKLHGFVHEWQVVASSEFSAAVLYNDLTELLISWRRIELSTWSRLLKIEDEKCLRDSKSWWFIAYESIIGGSSATDLDQENITNYILQLLAQLTKFLETTSLGQYKARLDLIETFYKHLLLLSSSNPFATPISSALQSFIQFYRRFQPAIDDLLAKGREKIEKDLKEIVLLASWKDTNINALRESAKRSHHKLFKVVRKYRTLLAGPVEAILQKPVTFGPDAFQPAGPIAETPEKPSEMLDSALQLCISGVSDWEHKAARYRNPIATARIMQRHSILPEAALDCGLYVSSFASNIVDAAQILRKETPSTLTKDNASTVKHLKSRKRKVFADTLKELRRMGFRSNIDSETLSRQRDIPSVLSNLTTDKRMNEAHALLFATLDNAGPIRSNVRGHSDDLTDGEVARSMGVFESILSNIVSQEKLSAQSLRNIDAFDLQLKTVQNLWSPDDYSVQSEGPRSHLWVPSVRERLVWLQNILRVSSTVLQKQSDLGGPDSVQLRGKLRERIEQFESMGSQIASLPNVPSGLTTDLHTQSMEAASNAIDEFKQQLSDWESEYPSAQYIFNQIKPWLDYQLPGDNNGAVANGFHSQSTLEAQTVIADTIDSMLVGMQTLQTTLNDCVQSSEDADWLMNAKRNLSKSLAGMHLRRLTHKVEVVLNSLCKFNGEPLRIATALCVTMIPILSQYRDAYKSCLVRMLDFHRSLCGMAQTLSRLLLELLESGFCSPQEKSNEQGANEKLEDGTGLGEGEGAEDISKDIKDDEDLSELAQEGAGKDDKEELEDEKDAVDMGADELEGEMGDAEEQSDQGDDDDRSDKSGEDMDEETGPVDDLDPSAVDEKTWDGKDDKADADKEKESNKPRGTKENELTAQNDDAQPVEDEDENENENDVDEEGAQESEEVRQETEPIDPHAAQEDNLDLPEDMTMDMDNDDKSIHDSEDDAMDGMSDGAVEEGEVQEQQNDESEDEAAENSETKGVDDTLEDDDEEVGDDEQGDVDPMDEHASEASCSDEMELPKDNEDDGHNEQSGHDTNDLMTDQANEKTPMDAVNDNTPANEREDDPEDSKAAGTQGRSGTEKPMASNTESSAQQNEAMEDKQDKTKQPFQKLGDALETWHRLNRQIQEANQEAIEQQVNEIDAQNPDQDFEHLLDKDAHADAQALGEATDEQAHVLDKEALDSEKQQQPQNFPIVEESNDLDVDQETTDAFNLDNVQKAEEEHNPTEILDKSRRSGGIAAEGDQTEAENEDDLDDLDNDMSTVQLNQIPQDFARSAEEAQRLWSYYEGLTRDLALSLTEQLRLVLAPTLASKMRGDFRTGKRLNIKRIIPYIASQYKRDKIWMRRSIPSKRSYQIMLALDDSKSMGESGSGKLAFETLALVSKSLSMLEVGQICIVGFGSDVQIAHEFEQPFSSEAGANVFRHFGFQQTTTNVQKLIKESLDVFREARAKNSNSKADLWQLQLIISDGICENHESIRRLLRQAHEERVMIVFVIVDALTKEPIVEMKQATFEEKDGQTNMKVKRYLEDFPFGYYLIVGDVKELPHVLATALRQWFAEVVESG